jgi:PHD/YefM family antitoxin component YafN of YafNO toxin-antitoxin module
METRYVTDEKGERVGVILDVREYERLMGALDALHAIARGEEELLPLDEAVQEMEEERSRLREAGELPGEKG